MSDNKKLEASRLSSQYSEKKEEYKDWMHWGPYLSERQWGTVREDYSAYGNAWDYFSHDQARSRAYRWGEDGLAGISDPEQNICFSLALWNGNDPILKERLFGLTNSEGNHGEDVKEYYYYVDNTPTHSYMKWLYKYPQAAFPYQNLVEENGRRKSDSHSFEYELMDTGVFNEDRYFDVQVEYAKSDVDDMVIKIRVTNQGPDEASTHVLPTILFRNNWSWFKDVKKPKLQGTINSKDWSSIKASSAADEAIKEMTLYCKQPDELLFVENETNNEKLWNSKNASQYVKDGINDFVVEGKQTVNPALEGTKASASYKLTLASKETKEIHLRFSTDASLSDPFGDDYESTFTNRIAEADEFYAGLAPDHLTDDQKLIQRQAYAGMLWSKQYYHYVVADWLDGDPAGPAPPASRDRNKEWRHMYASTIISMPDKWEYPWFAAWDLCFQTVVFARLDLQFAKNQLLSLAHDWYMAPNGAIPAYEWAFSDVNPPLHAWAALQIFNIEKEMNGGKGDLRFLKDIFQHCLINFTWWTNQQDEDSSNLFEGGFLGLDNISIINRSNLTDFENQIGHQVTMKQSDATSWMGMYCLNMMQIATELSAIESKLYSSFVSKFFQHFVLIADAMNSVDHASNGQVKLWDEEDGFYYDFLEIYANPTEYVSVKLRSLVGIISLFPVARLDLDTLDEDTAANLRERLDWFLSRHPELLDQVCTASTTEDGDTNYYEPILLSFVSPERLTRILERVLDEAEFLSPHGIRGISKEYDAHPYVLDVNGVKLEQQYAPAESTDGSFGGNSNWRGPVWFPINFMLIDTLKKYNEFLDEDYKVEYPTHSGNQITLSEVANELSKRMTAIFEKDKDGNRPVYGGNETMQKNPAWNELILFYEYFHGDNGAGIGASHQTGWTGLVAELLHQIK